MIQHNNDKVVAADLDALKLLMLDTIYPVGSIYMSVNNVSPSTLFGGTWEAIQDRFLLAAGSSYSGGTTGGSATHTPSGTLNGGAVGNHTLTVAEMPNHFHRGLFWSYPDQDVWNVTLDGGTYAYRLPWEGSGGSSTAGKGKGNEREFVTGQTGGNGAHNHPFTQPTFTGTNQNTMPPYLTVYMWKRVD